MDVNGKPPSLDATGEFHSPATCAALRERDERLELLKGFAGRLAHDFRNTLVPQLGYVTLIKEQAGEDAPVFAYASKLENAARKLEAYLDTILFAVRPERRFVPKACDFAALVKRAVDSWTNDLPKDAAIRVEASLAPCTLVVDEAHWTEVIGQLLKNARFALAAGGTVSIALGERPVTEEQAQALSVRGTDLFRLVIRDNGFGMSDAVLRRACEPFFSTRAKGQAAGLGLTIAYSVVRLHGGQLVLESSEDVGTTVTIWIPKMGRSPAEHRPNSSLTAPVASEPQRIAKILLVEPDPLLLEAIKMYLRRVPLEIVSAQDGNGGLRLFQREAPGLRAVVLDTTVTGISALELCSQIRQIGPQVPVILICGDWPGEPETGWSAGEAPRPVLLKKPFSLKALAEAIWPLIR